MFGKISNDLQVCRENIHSNLKLYKYKISIKNTVSSYVGIQYQLDKT